LYVSFFITTLNYVIPQPADNRDSFSIDGQFFDLFCPLTFTGRIAIEGVIPAINHQASLAAMAAGLSI
jgi:hypothetical protein